MEDAKKFKGLKENQLKSLPIGTVSRLQYDLNKALQAGITSREICIQLQVSSDVAEKILKQLRLTKPGELTLTRRNSSFATNSK